jgi:dTDP-4-amino-4,6-dideoxygalactose transaminase
MLLLRSHGITRQREDFVYVGQPSFYYEQQELGFNYRLTDIQAALGLSQLRRLPEFLNTRKQIAEKYNQGFQNSNVGLPIQTQEANSSWHLYVVRLGSKESPAIRNEAFETLRKRGIGVNLHYIPVYRHPYYAKMGFNPANFPQAESYYSQAISLPIHPELTSLEQDFVIKSVSEIVQ